MRWASCASELRPKLPRDRPWLSIVGIGEDGVAGLGDEAKRLIAEAEIVFGGKRHLALAAALIRGEARPGRRPFDAGDARRAGAARPARLRARLGRSVPARRRRDAGAAWSRRRRCAVVPAPSAFSLAAARLGWALQEIETVSLHGRPLDLIRPLLHPGRADPGADLGRRRRRRRSRALLAETRLRRVAAHGAGGAGRAGRAASAATRADGFDLDEHRSAQRRGDRGRGGAGGAHPAADAGPRRRPVRA